MILVLPKSGPPLDPPVEAITSVTGPVVHGDRRGRAIGFPTANLKLGEATLDDGVWAGWLSRPAGEVLSCAISVGRRSTFYTQAGERLLEAHVLDFDGDLYGEVVTVSLCEFLRGQIRFDGVDDLIRQLNDDVDRTRAWAADRVPCPGTKV